MNKDNGCLMMLKTLYSTKSGSNSLVQSQHLFILHFYNIIKKFPVLCKILCVGDHPSSWCFECKYVTI